MLYWKKMNTHRLPMRPAGLPRLVLETAYWVVVMFCCGVLLFVGLSHAWIVILAYAILALFVYGGYVEPHMLTTKKYYIPFVPNPSTKLCILFLSDLHAGAMKKEEFYERLVRRSKKVCPRPDLVILGGDLVEENADAIHDLKPFQALTATHGKYFVLGNHDYLDRPELVERALKKFGFEDITNTKRVIQHDGASFELLGLDDSYYGAPDMSLLPRNEGLPRLLVTHEPDLLLDLQEGDADLVLLGHTHGGQVPFMPLPQSAPQWLDRGLKEWRKTRVIISRGIGEAVGRIRFGSAPQIVVIEIGI